jgi:hypothetical protein
MTRGDTVAISMTRWPVTMPLVYVNDPIPGFVFIVLGCDGGADGSPNSAARDSAFTPADLRADGGTEPATHGTAEDSVSINSVHRHRWYQTQRQKDHSQSFHNLIPV